jgi:hypothetical protein
VKRYSSAARLKEGMVEEETTIFIRLKLLIFTKVRLLLRSAYKKQAFSLLSLIAIVQRYRMELALIINLGVNGLNARFMAAKLQKSCT